MKYFKKLKISSIPELKRLVFTPVNSYIILAAKFRFKIHLSETYNSFLISSKSDMTLLKQLKRTVSITSTALYAK
jgi:hypothetical protein